MISSHWRARRLLVFADIRFIPNLKMGQSPEARELNELGRYELAIFDL